MSAPVDRLPFAARMRALAEHALLLSEAEYRSVHSELDSGDSYHRHLALHYATVRRDIPEVVRALRDPMLRRRALSAAMRLPVPDEALVELVETAPRRDRLLVYGLVKRSRRRGLADALLPKVFERRGRVEASRLLSACSPAVVEEWLPRTGADLSVQRQLVRTAPKAVLALISDELNPRGHVLLLETLVEREPEAVGEFVARHPQLCRSARLALAALPSVSDVKDLLTYLDPAERARVLAALPLERRRDLVGAHSSADEVATLPVEERRPHVDGHRHLLAALPFEEVSEQLLRVTANRTLHRRALAWRDFLACAERSGDRALFASAVACTDRAWRDRHHVRTAVLEQVASAPRRLLDAVPTALLQRMVATISSHLDNSRRTRRALRRFSNRIGAMTAERAVQLVRRDPRDGLRPEVWEHIAASRTDLVDVVLDAGWPGPTRRTGRWNPRQRARYEQQAVRLATDDTVEMTVRAAAATVIRDQKVLANLVDSAPQSLAVTAIRGVSTQSVLVRWVETRPGAIAGAASRVLVDLVDGRWAAASVGGAKEQARLLAETRPPDAVDALLDMWRNGHRDVKAVAAASLLTFLGEDPRASLAVAEAMADVEPTIRQAVLQGRPATLTRDQLLLRARLVVEAIRRGRPDVIRAYGTLWRLAPEGFDRVVERAGGRYDPDVSAAITTAISAAVNTEVGDRAALSLLDRIVAIGVDVRQWLGDCRRIDARSERMIRRRVNVFLQVGMPRAAADVLFCHAIRTLDVTWWRELVAVVGDRPDRLPELSFLSSTEWDDHAAVAVLDELTAIGGYVCAKLAVRLVAIAGPRTQWALPWRDRLDELRAHEDIDIRELAGVVRVPERGLKILG
ncbi:hypothetical protein [Kutzneria kofuensis]|uniref:Uncharacterized protein n=1 Tax=Kutzneria kofuensis TaxID=103725 RepID=A0A7W9KM06_9PSEU|nr:hypothetical protein [Kutzneria kofuensis]MBB5894753.1 hypothetical protein [Kutzneria kofuensis]